MGPRSEINSLWWQWADEQRLKWWTSDTLLITPAYEIIEKERRMSESIKGLIHAGQD